MPGERDVSQTDEDADDPFIRSSVLFAAATDALLDFFSDARITGIKLQRVRAQLIACEIVERALRLSAEGTDASEGTI